MQKVIKRILKACSTNNINVEEARKSADLKSIGNGRNLHRAIDTVVMRDEYEIPVRMYFPNKETLELCEVGENILPVIMYIHGGGWVTDGIDNYERICAKLSRYTKHLVISVDYRLAPEHKFPIGLLDSYEVAKSICSDKFPYKLGTDDVTIMGDSAGGNLTAAICLMARDKQEFKPKRQVLIYPVVNNDYSESSPYASVQSKGESFVLTAGRMRDYIQLYESSEEDRNNPYFAPILAENLEDLPKTLVITAENDPLRDEGEDYGRRLKEAGNEVQIYRIDEAIHGYFGIGMNGPYVRETLQWIDRFIKETR